MLDERQLTETVCYLCGCAVNGEAPDTTRIERSELNAIYDLAKKHLLTSAVGMALESAGIRDDQFTKAVALAQRKNALLDADRMRVLAELEKAGIWYLPLKGCILKDMYPRFGMRQMADNDILFDASRRADVRRIMEGLGFTTEHYDEGNHDVYHKKPVSNFEMHVYLINGKSNRQLETYYLDIKDRLIRNEGSEYGYHFRDEDFYLFLLAHEYKHFIQYGTGLRSLLDTYVFLKQKEKELDWEYIHRETAKMGIDEFEKENRSLAMKVFRSEQLTEQDEKMLNDILDSGTYGSTAHYVSKQIREHGRFGYFLRRIFVPMEDMQEMYPVLQKMPFLYPLCWAWRLVSRFFTQHTKFIFELKAALGLNKEINNRK